jgi:hypothetical protein
MGWDLIPSLSNIHLDHSCSVDGKSFVWVYNHTEKARVGVNQLSLKADLQIMEDRSIIEKGKVCHVLTFLKLWWIDLSNLGRWENLFLKTVKRDIFKNTT